MSYFLVVYSFLADITEAKLFFGFTLNYPSSKVEFREKFSKWTLVTYFDVL